MSNTQTFAEDITTFFADFGVVATFTNGATATGIFDNGYLEINVGQSGQEGREPEFHLPSSGLPANTEEGDSLVIDGQTWYIKNLLQDATGVTILELSDE
jgi:hypothetical protein